jgi:excisionase family DNA binding protein
MKKIIVPATLSLAIILGALVASGFPAASVALGAPVELHQLHHIVLAAAIPAVKAELYTIPDVCRILAVRETTIYKLIAMGELIAIKIGNKTAKARGTRITAKSVDALLAAAPKVEITGKSYLTMKTRRRLAREQVQRA